MSAALTIELCDDRGNRVCVTYQAHANEYATKFTDDAQKLALKLLDELRKKEPQKTP